MKKEKQNKTREIIVREVRDDDGQQIIQILNHYVTTSYAAYPDVPVPDRFFGLLREGTSAFYVLECRAQVVGFGLMKSLLPFPVFATTGMLSYFIHPEYTGQGLGEILLCRLTDDAKKMGVTSLVANISSKNERSIRFHERHGFVEAGRLHEGGIKFGVPFDMVWMQKIL